MPLLEHSPTKITTGTLYIVATPIGNPDDISLRAVKILKQCDIVVCEEGKMGARLLHQIRVSKPLEELNEHNEQGQTTLLIERLEEGKSIALISDAGTPLFADPGLELVQRAVQKGIAIVPVPGASSVMTALVASCLPMQQFLFAGFLSREPKERLDQLRVHAQEPRTVVLLETPYRLLPLLEAAASIMPTRRAFLGCNLTMPSETLHHGTVAELLTKFQEHRFKGEFVFAFAGNDAEKKPRRFADKQFSERKFSDRRSSDRKFSDRQSSGRKFSDRQSSDRQSSGRKFSDRQSSDRRSSDRKFSDRQSSGRKFSDRQSSDGRSSDRKFSDRQSSGRKFSDRQSSDRAHSTKRFSGKRFSSASERSERADGGVERRKDGIGGATSQPKEKGKFRESRKESTTTKPRRRTQRDGNFMPRKK